MCFRVFLCSDLLSLVIRFKLLFRSFSLSCSPNRAHLHKTYHRFLFPLSFARALSLSQSLIANCVGPRLACLCVCVTPPYSFNFHVSSSCFSRRFSPFLYCLSLLSFFFSYGNIIYFIHKKKNFKISISQFPSVAYPYRAAPRGRRPRRPRVAARWCRPSGSLAASASSSQRCSRTGGSACGIGFWKNERTKKKKVRNLIKIRYF